jgi:hypothetical protein
MISKRPIHGAAAALYESIKAPRGAVNTLVGTENGKDVIRVLIDPMYQGFVYVPPLFMGYRISVEPKPHSVAHW